MLKITVLYTLFAVIATIVNLGSQAVSVWVYTGAFSIELSILVGTACGLIVKYWLDKHYIFAFETDNISHDGQLFVLYTVMGVATTLVFWGTEYLFHWLFATDAMRYLGGAIGLAIGYLIKYQLDRRYVFVNRNADDAASVVSQH